MMEPTRDGRGLSLARCTCDSCGQVTEFRCAHTLIGRNKHQEIVNHAQASKRLLADGWVLRGSNLSCPRCVADRRAQKSKPQTKEESMTEKSSDLRQPTREQKREIISLLTEVYDTKAERYRGAETDVTVAQTIGGGCMFGWVAAIREEMFGPDGGNEEILVLIEDVAKWRREADALAQVMHNNLLAFNEARKQVATLEARVAALQKSMGPRAAAVRAAV